MRGDELMEIALDDARSTIPQTPAVTAVTRAQKVLLWLGLLACLIGVCCVGCGIGKPPVLTLDQWDAQ